jgi:hypothetical protein
MRKTVEIIEAAYQSALSGGAGAHVRHAEINEITLSGYPLKKL